MEKEKRKCNCEMLIFSRVVGYYSPVKQWNKGKKEEFGLRKTFNIEKSEERLKRIEKERLAFDISEEL